VRYSQPFWLIHSAWPQLGSDIVTHGIDTVEYVQLSYFASGVELVAGGDQNLS